MENCCVTVFYQVCEQKARAVSVRPRGGWRGCGCVVGSGSAFSIGLLDPIPRKHTVISTVHRSPGAEHIHPHGHTRQPGSAMAHGSACGCVLLLLSVPTQPAHHAMVAMAGPRYEYGDTQQLMYSLTGMQSRTIASLADLCCGHSQSRPLLLTLS